MQREEPYLGLTYPEQAEMSVHLVGDKQVVHGCRQLVS